MVVLRGRGGRPEVWRWPSISPCPISPVSPPRLRPLLVAAEISRPTRGERAGARFHARRLGPLARSFSRVSPWRPSGVAQCPSGSPDDTDTPKRPAAARWPMRYRSSQRTRPQIPRSWLAHSAAGIPKGTRFTSFGRRMMASLALWISATDSCVTGGHSARAAGRVSGVGAATAVRFAAEHLT